MGPDSPRAWRHALREVCINLFKHPSNIDFSELGTTRLALRAKPCRTAAQRAVLRHFIRTT